MYYKGEWFDIEVPGFVEPDSKNKNTSIPNISIPSILDSNNNKPNYVDKNNATFESSETWEPVDGGVKERIPSFEMEEFLSSLSFDKVNDKPVPDNTPEFNKSIPHSGLILTGIATGILSSINKATEYYDIFFSYQKRGNKRRVIIFATNSSIRDFYNHYATDTSYSAISRTEYRFRAYTSYGVKQTYEKLTGKKLDKDGTYDMEITIDSRHKENKYSSYLWINKDGRIMEKPIIYPNDRIKFVENNNDEWLLDVDLESDYFETSDMNKALFTKGKFKRKSNGRY